VGSIDTSFIEKNYNEQLKNVNTRIMFLLENVVNKNEPVIVASPKLKPLSK
jgi:hypothetical protein